MILIIISVVLLLLCFVPFLIYVFGDDVIEVDTAACFSGALTILWIGMTAISAIFVIAGYNSFDPKKYDKLMHVIEYSDSYSMEVEENIENWNKKLNTFNNLWCRFSVEDRGQYYIDINIYLDKFKKC